MSLNTSETKKNDFRLLERQKSLIDSLSNQPLLVVLRPDQQSLMRDVSRDNLFIVVEKLYKARVKHIEIAWSPHPKWTLLIKDLQNDFPEIDFGAASITDSMALETVANLGMNYAMSPFWDSSLQSQARELNQLLIPGVFSPSEIHKANLFGCKLIKLFPATTLGMKYLNQLKVPLTSVPFVIAAGGLTVADINPWLKAGHGAIALGRGLFKDNCIDPALKIWLKSNNNLSHPNF